KRGPAAGWAELPAILTNIAVVARWGSRHGFVEQIPRPDAVVARLPDGIAFQAGNGLHAGFGSRSSLNHALQRFESVEAVDFDLAARRHQRLLDLHAQRQFQFRLSPGDRQAGASHQGKAELFRNGHHLGRFGAIVREMLVTERRNRLARLSKYAD